jgi:MraZ protein
VKDVFRGEVPQKVDAKARVSIPAAFRRVLDAGDPDRFPGERARFVIVYGDPRQTAVECYTMARMERIVERIMQAPDTTPNLPLVRRQMIQMSMEVEVDDDGRIVLPQKVREKLGVSADDQSRGFEAMFAGAGDRFQLWKRDTYEARQARLLQEDLARLPDDADLLSLLGPLAPAAPAGA